MKLRLFLCALALFTAFQAQTTQLTLHGSGVGLTQGNPDPYWTVVLPDGTSFGSAISATDPNGGWYTGVSPETWISIAARGSIPTGVYKYSTTFSIDPTSNPATAVVSGNWWADDQRPANGILLNGVLVSDFDGAIYNEMDPAKGAFAINAGFVSGLNTLTFLVENTGGPGGTLVRLSGAVGGDSVPDAGSTALLLLLGIIGVSALRWPDERTAKLSA